MFSFFKAWKQARIWEGFIKCCQKTRPHSFPLLLQLPPPQLKHVFQTAPELRDGLIRHLRSMPMTQVKTRNLIFSDKKKKIIFSVHQFHHQF